MKQFKIEVSHATPQQLATIALELKIMKEFKKEKSRKLQAASLTMDPGSCRIVLMTSFGAFPVDKFAKAPQHRKRKQ